MTTRPNFRVWNGNCMEYDITTGKFGTFFVNAENGDGLNPEDTASLSVNTTKYYEPIDLMMGLGINDVTETEIFEEDILLLQNNDTVTVKRNEYGFYFICDSDIIHDIDLHGAKIIGNTYKQKESAN